MSDLQVATRAYPKRKRAQISYYEGEPDDIEQTYESENEGGGFSANKKLKAKPKRLPKRKIFPFLSLPAELRNVIYAHALMDDDGVRLVSKTEHYRRVVVRDYPKLKSELSEGYRMGILSEPSDVDEDEAEKEPVFFVPSLLAVNRQIYAEALPILYSNKFIVEDTTALHAFMANITPRNRELLEDITIQRWGYSRTHKAYNHPGLTMLAGAVNLKRLNFRCTLGFRSGSVGVARQIYRDGFHWLEAVGLAKGKSDAAVELITISDENLGGRYRWGRPNPPRDPAMELQIFKNELRKLLAYKKPMSIAPLKGKSKGKGKNKGQRNADD